MATLKHIHIFMAYLIIRIASTIRKRTHGKTHRFLSPGHDVQHMLDAEVNLADEKNLAF